MSEKVAIIGSGNWGSAISKIVGNNVKNHPKFDPLVKMWVYEEMVGDRKLSEIINGDHENFVDNICKQMQGKIQPGARGISLIKGVECGKNGMCLISQIIKNYLSIDMCVLMGANIATEVAMENFCESTIGYVDKENASVFFSIFNTSYFRISLVEDVVGVELCGALKNVVAVAAGFTDGLKLGENTKAAVIRIGLMEMKKFCKKFYSGIKDETFFESCGIADVITTCFGGRNRKVAEAKVLTGKSIDALEVEMLNGQKLQGPLTAKEIYDSLAPKGLASEFPLFTAVYRICYENVPPADFFLHL